MKFKFKKKKIADLYTEEKNAHKYPNVIDDFFDAMSAIAAARDECD